MNVPDLTRISHHLGRNGAEFGFAGTERDGFGSTLLPSVYMLRLIGWYTSPAMVPTRVFLSYEKNEDEVLEGQN